MHMQLEQMFRMRNQAVEKEKNLQGVWEAKVAKETKQGGSKERGSHAKVVKKKGRVNQK